ncbi:M23 family metallopeptidase [Sphingobium algorifonticola]|uniref:M23 family metallopeptidase n=1 Tax=Sphingobium algorifonticola TaxID=2008318 RepID=A0A437J9J1_9SPHN|nr:M23 family metallopeptidase [Sphingobium algorifonticola]RVT42168.1 M23 family metallopeptidase [Sphingobium algorifonticola]
MFQKSEFGSAHGGASASLWLSGAIASPGPLTETREWRTRLRDWAEDVDLVPDLGQRVGSLTWFRGLATCTALCAGAIALSPGFDPIPGAPEPMMDARQFDEVRSQMITPLAMGADSGRHMGATDAVSNLRETPERPQIELTAQIGSGDSFARALSRAGVSSSDAGRVIGLTGLDMRDAALRPGTRLDIVLGRRTSRAMPRPLESLSFRARLDLAIDIRRVNGALVAQRIPIRVDDTPLRIRGTVGDSIYRSARAAGAPPKAIQAFLRTLSQQIAIGAVGAGDRYDMIVAHRRAETGEAEVGDLLYAGLDRARGKDIDLLKWTSGGRSEWFEASGVGERRGVLSQPVSGRLSSGFGMRRHPILGFTRMHAGIDFAAHYGSPIYAVTDGIVEYAGRHGGHGNYVKLRHGGGIATGYAHMSRIASVPGQRVRRGQVIGYVGSSGLSTGPHLHYELYRNGHAVNPASVSFTTTAQLAGRDLAAFRARLAALKAIPAGVQTAQGGGSARGK